MEYIGHIDPDALAAIPPHERASQLLFDHPASKDCRIECVRTPAGEGSPAGLHTHAVDQVFYVLSGTMSVEIAGRQYQCPPGTLIVFPAGVAHRNWNAGTEPTLHLALKRPCPW